MLYIKRKTARTVVSFLTNSKYKKIDSKESVFLLLILLFI